MKIKKKGVSPIVATILLVAIVIVIGIIIFIWARGFVSERVEKFGRAVELSCEDVVFEAGFFTDTIEVINRGNVPIYGFDVKKLGVAEVLVNEYPGTTVSLGGTAEILIGTLDEDITELNIVPIILGETESGKIARTCPDQFGYVVPVI